MSTPSQHQTLATACRNTPKLRAGINQRNFFENMKHLFASSFSVVGEMMQNARRAGATHVAFKLVQLNEKPTLVVTDDGCGINDFQILIALCDSGWDDQIQLTDKPFGIKGVRRALLERLCPTRRLVPAQRYPLDTVACA